MRSELARTLVAFIVFLAATAAAQSLKSSKTCAESAESGTHGEIRACQQKKLADANAALDTAYAKARKQLKSDGGASAEAQLVRAQQLWQTWMEAETSLCAQLSGWQTEGSGLALERDICKADLIRDRVSMLQRM